MGKPLQSPGGRASHVPAALSPGRPVRPTRQELLNKEGRRVKECYRRESSRTGVPWRWRECHHGNFSAGEPVNQAVTAAAQCLYGIAHSVVAALGCCAALGFVRSGHERSFVLDIADLYKTGIGIPAAFDAAAEGEEDVASRTRRALRDRINATGLLNRCVRAIKELLTPIDAPDRPGPDDFCDQVTLQSDGGRQVASGRNYSTAEHQNIQEEPLW